MRKKISFLIFRIIKSIVKAVYPKITVEGIENLPDEEAIYVGNHSQMHGPICCELYFPCKRVTWCAGQMMELKEVPAYAYKDFWSEKPKIIRPFYKLLSYIIAPLSVIVFNNAETIGVYQDRRIVSTFRKTVEKLAGGESVLIFPECKKGYNNIVNSFQDKYINIAKLYYKKTGKELKFVPFYIAPNLKKMYIGTPTTFSPEEPIDSERDRITEYLMKEITDIATGLPEHTVIPYKNIPKKEYKTNYEKTGC